MRYVFLILALFVSVPVFGQSTDCKYSLTVTEYYVPGVSDSPDYNGVHVLELPRGASSMTLSELSDALDNLCCLDLDYFQVGFNGPVDCDPWISDSSGNPVGLFEEVAWSYRGTPPEMYSISYQNVINPDAAEELDLKCNTTVEHSLEVWAEVGGVWQWATLAVLSFECDGECVPLPNGNQPLVDDGPFPNDWDFQPLTP